MTFITRFGPFDILFEPSGAPAYDELERQAVVLTRFDRDIAVASIEHLIAMKRTTGREKDAATSRSSWTSSTSGTSSQLSSTSVDAYP